MQHIISVIEQHGLLVVFLNVLLAQSGLPLPAFPTLISASARPRQRSRKSALGRCRWRNSFRGFRLFPWRWLVSPRCRCPRSFCSTQAGQSCLSACRLCWAGYFTTRLPIFSLRLRTSASLVCYCSFACLVCIC